tara:strand:- start:1965 stop:2318 length:354 start_codon:yes stop_codon:yes gene_type:complete
MLTVPDEVSIYLYNQPIDMRKGINGLTILLVNELSMQPQQGDLFVFRNRRGDKVKIIHWHKNGFMIHYKCLESGKFRFPQELEDQLLLTSDQLSWLLAGLDFILMTQCPEINFEHYY